MESVGRSTLDYVLLWDVSDNSYQNIKWKSSDEARRWPGFPIDPISPNPIPVDIKRYRPPVRPIPSLVGRQTYRKGGYSSLTNYNNLP